MSSFSVFARKSADVAIEFDFLDSRLRGNDRRDGLLHYARKDRKERFCFTTRALPFSKLTLFVRKLGRAKSSL